MPKPSLQIALDTTDLKRALSVAAQTIRVADRIEVGTPLLRAHGMCAVEAVRKTFPDAVVVADCKIMDYGEMETKLAIEAGADGVIVQAVAPLETVEAVCLTAQSLNAFAMVDCIGISDLRTFAKEVRDLPISHLILHKNKDEQRSSGPIRAQAEPGLILDKDLPPLAVAGGITPGNAAELADMTTIDTIIVGQAIVGSPTPESIARSILATWTRSTNG
jgi:3-hexulose-6-phosphate synthase